MNPVPSTQVPLLTGQVFTEPVDRERSLIYAPLRNIAFIGNTALVNLVLDACARVDAGLPPGELEDSFISMLDGMDFFTPAPEPADDCGPGGPRYDTVVLFLTNACNLRCRYCYAHAGDHPVKTMDAATARAAIDIAWADARRHGAPTFTLAFHGGGEPTMNLPVLRESVGYFKSISRDSGVEISIAGAFNGCWSDETREYILSAFTEASISLDGPPEIQDFARPCADGSGSFARVDRTLRGLDGAGFPYGIRMTVTSESLDRLPESVAEICARYSPGKIQAEPVFMQGRAAGKDSMAADPGRFIGKFMQAYEAARTRGVELFYSGARPDVLTRRFCLAAGRALVVTADGDVTACFESYGREHPLAGRFLVGSLGPGGLALDGGKLDACFTTTVDSFLHCARCFCKWHCAGDCAIKSLAEGGGEVFRSTERCAINRGITKLLLLDRIRGSGGVIWKGTK
ncbi:MAG: radical SAM protein [Spirochaetes bacterium]|nr:MAG: radical SAM protein [Spirochaetota bacterium]